MLSMTSATTIVAGISVFGTVSKMIKGVVVSSVVVAKIQEQILHTH